MRTALALAALLAANLPALAETAPPAISVTGEAQVQAAPDLAQIDGGVTTEAKTAREASEANNKAMAAVLPALKAAGIPETDIQTSRLSLQPPAEAAHVLVEGILILILVLIRAWVRSLHLGLS